VARHPAWRWGVGAAFLIALLMTIVMHDTDYLHLPPKKDPLRRAKGWEDFAAHVQRAREKYRTNLLLSDHYSQASMMAFYLPDQPMTYLLPEPYGATQFTLWPEYTVHPDTRALYVTASISPPSPTLQAEFTHVELIDDFWALNHGQPVTEFRIYFCQRSSDQM
jgi:hypothetical protein